MPEDDSNERGRSGARSPRPRRWRSELRLAARTTVAALLAYAAAELLRMGQAYWAVLTAVIVMQASLGGSLKAMFDRLAGTVGGAAWGVVVAFLVPHGEPGWIAIALALAVAPAAFAAALKPWLRIAPVTAVIVLLSTQAQTVGPLAYGFERVLEILLGVAVAIVVALLILPDRAHGALAEAASRTLTLMSELAPLILPDPAKGNDGAALIEIHARIRRALAKVETSAEEARRERAGRLTDDPEPEPLRRNLNRLRHDLTMIGRATAEPLPQPLAERLAPETADLAGALRGYLADCARALDERRGAASREAIARAIGAHATAVSALRREGQTRALTAEQVSRLFGLSFSLEQLTRELHDLAERIDEMAGQQRTGGRKIG